MPVKSIPKGTRFGKLTVVNRANNSPRGRAMWRATCDCGNSINVEGVVLRNGHVSSCGCGRIDAITKHSLHDHPMYNIWKSMMRRCYNPKASNYKNYGARGIDVYGPWHDVSQFIKDCEHLYKPKQIIDRIDNDAGYYPGNIRWVDSKTSVRNRRTTVTLTLNGKTQSVTDWSRELGLSRSALYQRVYKGWADEVILTTPVQEKRKPK